MNDIRRSTILSLVALVALVAACGEDEGGGEECPPVDAAYNPVIDPARFVDAVDNPLFPLVPGATFQYREGTNATVDITVTTERRMIAGVSTVVVHDVVTIDGDVREDTLDWYAQDVDGAVWYFGEDTMELRDGRVLTREGSWEHGVDGAKAGLIIPAMPMVGQRYRQEYYACHAEDYGEVLALDASVTVTAGSYTGCYHTHDYTPLETDVNEQKWYCPGIGVVLSLDVATGEREELISMTVP
jgi:hypothetical protein